MIQPPTNWYCICDRCGDDMSGDFNQELEEFKELLEGRGWVFFNGQWLCPDCAEDAGDFMKGEN